MVTCWLRHNYLRLLVHLGFWLAAITVTRLPAQQPANQKPVQPQQQPADQKMLEQARARAQAGIRAQEQAELMHVRALDSVSALLFNGQSESSFRSRLQSQANQRLTQVQSACQLEPQQLDRLKLAIEGDIANYFHDVQVIRAKFVNHQQNQANLKNVLMEAQPMMNRAQAGLFDEKSLFNKILNNTLTDAQQIEYKRSLDDLMKQRHHALSLSTLAALQRSLPLLETQREQLLEQMSKIEIKDFPRQYEPYVGYAKLAKVPDDVLKKILSPSEHKEISIILNRYAPVLNLDGLQNR